MSSKVYSIASRPQWLNSSPISINLFRVRRRNYTTSVVNPDGPALTATNRAEATLKRFWKNVGVESKPDGFVITLDKRPLKTPFGKPLQIPHRKRLLATLLANEWENQEKILKSHALPMTSLTSRAIDGLAEKTAKDELQAALLNYLDTDTICFHDKEPPALAILQETHWQPLLTWLREEFNVKVKIFDSVIGAAQCEQTKAVLSKVLEEFDEWQLAAMERATHATKSFIIAIALVQGRVTVEEAAVAAHVEVNSQIERWGEVEDTHDVDFQEIRRQLGSAACLLSNL